MNYEQLNRFTDRQKQYLKNWYQWELMGYDTAKKTLQVMGLMVITANTFNIKCEKASKISNDKELTEFESKGISLRQMNDLCERRR